MSEIIFNDPFYGTTITLVADEVRVKVAAAPFGQHTVQLELDEIDRLLAVNDHAASEANAVADIAEFFVSVYHVQPRPAERAAKAFIASARSLARAVEQSPYRY